MINSDINFFIETVISKNVEKLVADNEEFRDLLKVFSNKENSLQLVEKILASKNCSTIFERIVELYPLTSQIFKAFNEFDHKEKEKFFDIKLIINRDCSEKYHSLFKLCYTFEGHLKTFNDEVKMLEKFEENSEFKTLKTKISEKEKELEKIELIIKELRASSSAESIQDETESIKKDIDKLKKNKGKIDKIKIELAKSEKLKLSSILQKIKKIYNKETTL
ncbi:MAG: hypothetical protein ACOX2F_02620 [bacterium]